MTDTTTRKPSPAQARELNEAIDSTGGEHSLIRVGVNERTRQVMLDAGWIVERKTTGAYTSRDFITPAGYLAVGRDTAAEQTAEQPSEGYGPTETAVHLWNTYIAAACLPGSGPMTQVRTDALNAIHGEALSEAAFIDASDEADARDLIHLRGRYATSITCGEVGTVRVTEVFRHVTCPRCKYTGDVSDRTRALTVEAAHAEALEVAARIARLDWRDACYRRAVQINAATPHMGEAADTLTAEAHAEALEVDAQRTMAGMADRNVGEHARQIEAWVARHDAGISPAARIRADEDWAYDLDELRARAIADTTDDDAWGGYCATLPDPTDAELAAVVAEYAIPAKPEPYLTQLTDSRRGFAQAHLMLRAERAAGTLTPAAAGWYLFTLNTRRRVIATYKALAVHADLFPPPTDEYTVTY